MVVPALSMSISHASFQAELEGAILQQTASVDFYLQTAAPKWTADSYQQHHDDGCPTGLRSLFLSDLNTCSWHSPAYTQDPGASFVEQAAVGAAPWMPDLNRKRRPRVQPLQAADGAAAQLEQFLQDDLHRFMEIREQLDHQASASDAAVLASTAEERQRRLSGGSSSSSVSNSGISFVRLPEEDQLEDDDEEDAEQSHPVAAALAAAAAMSAFSGMAVAPPATQQEQQPDVASTSGAAASTAAATNQFVMEADEEIAAQKRAARARLAELEQQQGSAGSTSQHEVAGEQEAAAAASSAKALDAKMGPADDCMDDSTMIAPGSLHSSKVPSRPRGLVAAAMPPPSKSATSLRMLPGRLLSRLWELNVVSNDGVLLQHNQFLQHMLAGLVLCVVTLPVLWLLQADGGSRGAGFLRSCLPASLLVKAEMLCHVVYTCSSVGVLLYCLTRSLLLHPPLLHFREPQLERQYLLWSNSGRLFQDCMFQLTFLVVGSCLWLRLLQSGVSGSSSAAAAATELLAGAAAASPGDPATSGRLILSALTLMGSGLPVLMLVLLRSPRYVEWREPLLAGSRLCSVLALSVMQLAAGPGGLLQLNMPFIALAQVMSMACMQVRLSSFVPSQVLHLLVLVLCTRAVNPLLQFTQLFGGWLCLPCLVLYNMEMHSRRAFLATLAPSASSVVPPPGKAVAA